jgi:prolyl-tRNA editing enzyme YbaK/EbsC (Cys-tRNA(Pro) deacylase)
MVVQQLSVTDVRAHLAPHGIAVQELPVDTSTAPLAAQALGTTVGTIVKSLLFLADGAPVLILAAGDRKVNTRRLARDLQAEMVRLAKPDEVIALSGYAVGGVPPIAHRTRLPTLVDRHLLDHATVYAAAGATNAIFPIAPQRLLELTGGRVTDAVDQLSAVS